VKLREGQMIIGARAIPQGQSQKLGLPDPKDCPSSVVYAAFFGIVISKYQQEFVLNIWETSN